MGVTEDPVRRWLGCKKSGWEGHCKTFAKEHVMVMIWFGQGDGAALERLLINQCMEIYGSFYGVWGHRPGGRCLNIGKGGERINIAANRPLYVYLIHRCQVKLHHLATAPVGTPYNTLSIISGRGVGQQQ